MGGGSAQVRDLEAQGERRVVAQHADLAEVDVVGEADHAPGARMTEEQEREADAREQDEEGRREDENRDREQAGGREEAAPDDAPATQDARHVDGQAGAVARALAVVALDLAAEVAEHERAGRDDEEAEEAEPVGEAAAEHRAGDEVEEREDDDLLVVRGAAARGEPDDLEDRGELDGDVERESPREQAAALDRQQNERGDGREVAESRASLPALRDERAPERGRRGAATFVQRLSDAVLTTARTPSAASASVMTRWTRPNLMIRRLQGGAARAPSTGSSSARKRRSGSAPRVRSPRASPPAVVATATPSPRLRCATAREATSRIARSNVAQPLVAGRGGADGVERERRRRARLARALAHDELSDGRSCASRCRADRPRRASAGGRRSRRRGRGRRRCRLPTSGPARPAASCTGSTAG